MQSLQVRSVMSLSLKMDIYASRQQPWRRRRRRLGQTQSRVMRRTLHIPCRRRQTQSPQKDSLVQNRSKIITISTLYRLCLGTFRHQTSRDVNRLHVHLNCDKYRVYHKTKPHLRPHTVLIILCCHDLQPLVRRHLNQGTSPIPSLHSHPSGFSSQG